MHRGDFRAVLLKALVCGASVGTLFGQTQVDLRTQSKQVDFGGAVSTRPMKTGTSLPGTCQNGEFFFNSNAPAGANIFACVASNTWVAQGGLPGQGGNASILSSDGTSASWVSLGGDLGGAAPFASVTGLQGRPVSQTAPQTGQALVWTGVSWQSQSLAPTAGTITIQSNGTVVGTRGVQNLVPGTGLTTAITDTGTRLNIQQSVDTAVVLTRSAEQSGSGLWCSSASSSATAYTCALSPILGSYTTGMVLHWKPDVAGLGGATTMNVNSLGTKSIKLADGTSDPGPWDIVAGAMYALWYDGTQFRIANQTSSFQASVSTRPACGASYRGKLWQTLAANGTKDDVAVCAKAADDTYAWRTIY